MSTSSFRVGATVEIDERQFKLVREINDSTWQLEDCITRLLDVRSLKELRKLYEAGRLIFIKQRISSNSTTRKLIPLQLETVPEEVKIRRMYVKAIQHLPNTRSALMPIIKKVWNDMGLPKNIPHVTSVMRWRKNLEQAEGNYLSLVSDVKGRGNRSSRYPAEIVEIVNQAIDEHYMTRVRNTIQFVLEQVLIAVKTENRLRPSVMHLPRPTIKVVKTLISKISAYDKYRARHGKDAADVKFRSVLGHRTTKKPLERAEIDHTPLDMFVVDEDSFVPLGRPYLTTCIDDNTRCILGFHIGFQPPSYLSVAKCLRHAFMPKESLRSTFPSIKNNWEPHGVMRELVVDNGAEFHSDALEIAFSSLGGELHYAPRKKGAFKGKIERFQGTMNGSVAHVAPGTTFSNIFEREDYDPVKHAVVTYSALKEIVFLWIVDYYMQKPHRGLDKRKPIDVWREGIRLNDIRVPDDPGLLDAILGRREKRRLTHKGIELDSLFYNSEKMTVVRRQYGDVLDVDIRVDDEDLGRIWVRTPNDGQLHEVPALKFDYANKLTRWQHNTCRKFARNHGGDDSDESWLEAREKISEIIANQLSQKRKKTRKLSQRASRFLEEERRATKTGSDLEQSDRMKKDVVLSNFTAQNDHSQKLISEVRREPTTNFRKIVIEKRDRSKEHS